MAFLDNAIVQSVLQNGFGGHLYDLFNQSRIRRGPTQRDRTQNIHLIHL